MNPEPKAPGAVQNGQACRVVAGTHRGKAGIIADLHSSPSGHLTLTVVQADGQRFKTLARHVVVEGGQG